MECPLWRALWMTPQAAAPRVSCVQTRPVSYATLVVALNAVPQVMAVNGKELLETGAKTAHADPADLTVRVIAGSAVAAAFATKQQNQRLIVSGDLILDADKGPVLYARVICDAADDQFLNEVMVVGRIAGEPRSAESGKSASRSLAVNRFVNGEEVTDWFKLRGFGYWKERLENAPKGALVSVAGFLDQRTNKEGKPYTELKVRSLRTHAKSKGGGGGANPAAGTTAAGYAAEDFSGEGAAMPFDWS